MTVSDLIAKLSAYPPDARVTLLEPERGWLLPIEIARLPADGSSREVDFIAITADSASDEIEGIAGRRERTPLEHSAGSQDRERHATS
jgi:hypothetical protein